MDIEALWEAGLSECFAGEFDQVSRLFTRDEGFAEMCRDFVEINALAVSAHSTDQHVHDCLTGLKDEILTHFVNSRP